MADLPAMTKVKYHMGKLHMALDYAKEDTDVPYGPADLWIQKLMFCRCVKESSQHTPGA